MPMTFTPEMVRQRLETHGLSVTGLATLLRERLAAHVEDKYGDYLEAWEIRTGRPWPEMTKAEAAEMVTVRPDMARNPAVLSRLLQKEES